MPPLKRKDCVGQLQNSGRHTPPQEHASLSKYSSVVALEISTSSRLSKHISLPRGFMKLVCRPGLSWCGQGDLWPWHWLLQASPIWLLHMHVVFALRARFLNTAVLVELLQGSVPLVSIAMLLVLSPCLPRSGEPGNFSFGCFLPAQQCHCVDPNSAT